MVSRDYAHLEQLASIIARAKEHKPEQQSFDFDRAAAELARQGIANGLKPQELTEAVERQSLIALAEVCEFNKEKMAEAMNCHRNTLYQTLKRHQIEVTRKKKVRGVAAQDEGKKQA